MQSIIIDGRESDIDESDIKKRNNTYNIKNEDEFLFRMEENGDLDRNKYQMMADKFNSYVEFHNNMFFFAVLIFVLAGLLLAVFTYDTYTQKTTEIEKKYVIYTIFPIYLLVFIMLLVFRKYHKITMFILLMVCALVGYLFGLINNHV